MSLKYAVFVPLALSGCGMPDGLPLAGPLTAAADPAAVSAAPVGPKVEYTPRPINEPLDWRELNTAAGAGS